RGKPLPEVFQAFDATTGVSAIPLLEESCNDGKCDTEPRTFKLRCPGSSDAVFVEAEMSTNRDGEAVFGSIVAFRDVTERRNAEERERQLQKRNAMALMAVGLGREFSESQRKMDDSLIQLISRSKGRTLRMLREIYECSAYQQTVA